MTLLAAVSGGAAEAFVELGAVVLALAVMARLAGWLRVTAIPLYLLVGLSVGEGGLTRLEDSAGYLELTAQIGVLMLLLTLGLEYSGDELRSGMRTGLVPGLVDAAANFTPGFVLGLALGWEPVAAVLLGGVCWVSSSGVVAKVLSDLRRLGNRETPAVLNVLVIEDLAMAVYLPVVAAVIAGQGAPQTVLAVTVALVAVAIVLFLAIGWGDQLSALLAPGSNETLLLGVFGLTLLIGGLAEELQVSSAIGAFLVGLALSGTARDRAVHLIEPVRDLFAAVFFLYFGLQIEPGSLLGALPLAVGLAAVTGATKVLTGGLAAHRLGAGAAGQRRAGTALIARGEFSIVIAALGAGTADGSDLTALAAAYVLVTAVLGPLATKYADQLRRIPAFGR